MKKGVWPAVADLYNAQADTQRKPDDLQKKWDNLTQVHRAKYSDYVRATSATGGGPCKAQLSTLTDAVMGVIGKSAVNVVGIAPELGYDTTWLQVNNTTTTTNTCTVDEGTSITDLIVTVVPTQDNTCTKCQCFQCKETRKMKRKKLEYQLEFYKRKLNEQ